MNNGELKQAILDYSHRPDVAPQLDLMLELTANRIGRHLQSNENMQRVELAMATDTEALLPADFQQLIHMATLDHILQPVSPERLLDYQASGGEVEVFLVRGRGNEKRVDFGAAPGKLSQSGIFLDYYHRPLPMKADDDTNNILDAFPQLYLYGALAEVFTFTQDTDPRQAALDTFLTEVDEINLKANSGRWAGGASTGS